MKRVQGSAETKPIECVSKVRNKWRVRWDFCKEENGCSYMEEEFIGRPSVETVRKTIEDYYNDKVDMDILSGFVWNGYNVWLSQENQFNYKATFDLASMTGSSNLPAVFKFSKEGKDAYHTFGTLDELLGFYTQMLSYIQQCVEEGWKKKDSVDYKSFEP